MGLRPMIWPLLSLPPAQRLRPSFGIRDVDIGLPRELYLHRHVCRLSRDQLRAGQRFAPGLAFLSVVQ